ncbi:ribonuclease H-like domain-containing protein, partial [Gorgonomyces haynaldii]
DKPAQSLSDRLVVYTDGACSSNGTSSAKAGIGVYFGPDDPRNVSCPLPDVQGQHPTNNRAELYAVIKAMETVEEKCIIYTDSQYTVKGLTEWMPGWKKRGWTKADGKAVLNVDLWKRLDTIYDKHKHQIVHVKGHVGNHGNEMADRLAVQ